MDPQEPKVSSAMGTIKYWLSLIQFQYDGPLPTVAAGSQSGLTRPPTQEAPTTAKESEAPSSDTK